MSDELEPVFGAALNPLETHAWRRVPRSERRSVEARLTTLAEEGCDAGIVEHEALRRYVHERFRGERKYGSVLAFITLAALAGVIQWIVKRVLDRRFPPQPKGEARDGA